MFEYPTPATMPDPGFVPGLIGVGIQMIVDQIIRHIKIVSSYRKELGVLKVSLMRIEPIVKEIQHIRLAWNNHKDEVSAVDDWFEELEALLKQASEIVHPRNLIGRWDVVSRHQTSTKITNFSKDIDKQLTLCSLVHMVQYHELSRKMLEGQTEINERIEALMASSSSSAITYQGAHAPTGTIYSEKGNKTVTLIASRLSNLSKVSSFQDQQLDSHGFESNDVKQEEDRTQNQWFGQALCDYPASCDYELYLTAGEEFEILNEQEEYFYVSKKLPGRDGKVAGWVPVLFVNSYCSSFSVATTRYLEGDKTETGTANRLSNPSKVSSFQDQQLDACVLESYENPMAGHLKQGFVSHDTEEGVPTENHWLGKALCDFPARCDAELNLTAGEEVKILAEEEEWFYVSNGKRVGWVPMLFVNSY